MVSSNASYGKTPLSVQPSEPNDFNEIIFSVDVPIKVLNPEEFKLYELILRAIKEFTEKIKIINSNMIVKVVIVNKNSKVGCMRNIAILIANGDYISITDDDDPNIDLETLSVYVTTDLCANPNTMIFDYLHINGGMGINKSNGLWEMVMNREFLLRMGFFITPLFSVGEDASFKDMVRMLNCNTNLNFICDINRIIYYYLEPSYSCNTCNIDRFILFWSVNLGIPLEAFNNKTILQNLLYESGMLKTIYLNHRDLAKGKPLYIYDLYRDEIAKAPSFEHDHHNAIDAIRKFTVITMGNSTREEFYYFVSYRNYRKSKIIIQDKEPMVKYEEDLFDIDAFTDMANKDYRKLYGANHINNLSMFIIVFTFIIISIMIITIVVVYIFNNCNIKQKYMKIIRNNVI